jgi:hypothetical protein
MPYEQLEESEKEFENPGKSTIACERRLGKRSVKQGIFDKRYEI